MIKSRNKIIGSENICSVNKNRNSVLDLNEDNLVQLCIDIEGKLNYNYE